MKICFNSSSIKKIRSKNKILVQKIQSGRKISRQRSQSQRTRIRKRAVEESVGPVLAGRRGWCLGRDLGVRDHHPQKMLLSLARDRVSRIIRKWEYSWHGRASSKLSSNRNLRCPTSSFLLFVKLSLASSFLFYRALYLVFIPRKRFVAARSDARIIACKSLKRFFPFSFFSFFGFDVIEISYGR